MPPKKGKKGGKDKGECSYHQNNSIGAVLRYNASAVLSTVNNQGVPPLRPLFVFLFDHRWASGTEGRKAKVFWDS